MWYLKNRRNGARPPIIAAAVLLCVTCEFGMCTFTCFDGWLYDIYYPFSFMECGVFLFLIAAINKTYKENSAGTEQHSNGRMQNILKLSYFAIVFAGSVGGVLLDSWIRDALSAGICRRRR